MKPHTLRPNHSERIPSRHVFVDVESTVAGGVAGDGVEAQVFRLWCASSSRFYKGVARYRADASGTTVRSFWDWLWAMSDPRAPVWIWSHNAFVDATWLQLWEGFDAGELTYQASVLESPPFIVWFGWNDRKFVWVDTVNWWRCSLAELGESIGIPKGSFPGMDATLAQLKPYCEQDVRILQTAVHHLLTFVRENNLGMLRFTAPGQAFASWRHTHGGPWPRIHGLPGLSERERSAYSGGRCSIFYRGRVLARELAGDRRHDQAGELGPTTVGSGVYHLDARSFYPSMMKANLFPYRHVWSHGNISADHLFRIIQTKAAVARVYVDSDRLDLPVREDGETNYYRGCFWTQLCTPELKLAFSYDAIKSVAWAETYSQTDLFTKWIDKVYKLRQTYENQNNAVWSGLCKMLLNSLYGKFGQLTPVWKDRKDLPAAQSWGYALVVDGKTGEVHQGRVISRMVQIKDRREEANHSFVPISAHVTSYGRVVQQEWLDLVGCRGCYYSDTDSIHTNLEGLQAIERLRDVASEELGALGFRKRWQDVQYIARKCYIRDGHLVAAGISRNAFRTGPTQFTMKRWEKMASLIGRGPDTSVRVADRVEDLLDWDPGAQFASDGWLIPATREEAELAEPAVQAPF